MEKFKNNITLVDENYFLYLEEIICVIKFVKTNNGKIYLDQSLQEKYLK